MAYTIEDCKTDYKRSDKNLKESSLEPIRDYLYTQMENGTLPIQYIRSRMKDPVSLERKLEDEWEERYNEKIQSYENLINEINDLAGIRLLVLYRSQIPLINEAIWKSDKWQVDECTAYYDEERFRDKEWFEDHGFKTKEWLDGRELSGEDETRPILEKTERGYSSVHYDLIIDDNFLNDKIEQHPSNVLTTTCEVQVRTIHQEAWGEFDHHLKYPSGYVDQLASRMIRRLSQLLNFAEDIVSDIRSSPANTLFSNHLVSAYEDRGKLDDEERVDVVVNKFLNHAKYLGRSAPLAALKILTQSKNTCSNGPSNEVISLDYGEPEDWEYKQDVDEPIRRCYLDAHKIWVNNGDCRKVKKYLVWSGDKVRLSCYNLVRRFSEEINFVIIPKKVFEILMEFMDREVPNIGLRSTQFFMWDLDDPSSFDLDDMVDDIYGFYSPAKTPELTSSIIHIKEKPKEDRDLVQIDSVSKWRFQTIRILVSILESLEESNLIVDIQNDDHSVNLKNIVSDLNYDDVIKQIDKSVFVS